MVVPRRAEPSRPTDLAALLADLTDPARSPAGRSLALLPRVLHELTEVQRHVLARAATHCWTHGGHIPYFPPTDQQRAVAWTLAASEVRLLAPSWVVRGHSFRLAFRLTRVGEVAARRVLHVVPSWVWGA